MTLRAVCEPHRDTLNGPTVSSWQLSPTRVGLVLGALVLCSRISISLPFTPVPLSLAPQLVCSLALMCPRTALAAVVLFVWGGAMHLPFFSGGHGGCAHLMGPCGGYLAGYLSVALMACKTEYSVRANRKFWIFAKIYLGSALILGLGFLRLAQLVGLQRAWHLGVQPFLVGDFLIKCPYFALLCLLWQSPALCARAHLLRLPWQKEQN